MESEQRAEETQGFFFSLLAVLQFIFSTCPDSKLTPTCTQTISICETIHSEIAQTYPTIFSHTTSCSASQNPVVLMLCISDGSGRNNHQIPFGF